MAKEALKDLLSKEDKPITPTEILRVVAAHYGLKVADLKQKSNAKTIAFPRQVAMYLCKELTDLSYPEIGKLFDDKHHSTVMYSVAADQEACSTPTRSSRAPSKCWRSSSDERISADACGKAHPKTCG